MGITIDPQDAVVSNWTLWFRDGTPLRAITALLVKITEEIVGSPLTIFVPHALLDSRYTQHFSVSCLT